MRILGILFTLIFSVFPAFAEGEIRYRFTESDAGILRMDLQTGQISQCTHKNEQLVCRLAADEREAYNGQSSEELLARIEALETRIANLEGRQVNRQPLLGSDEEFERSLGYMERMVRSFADIVKELDSEK